ncbi:hypothetical protein EJV47_21285 [Hymenobacter gummosus]|uniref:Uncharacterized protein n=1 Tax=Hymenobacter gummosus TaxID=1776032 RepID=A0A431TX85_9BACT|nr:hypothetical protein [Hymenobacter gummosus]RTQ46490.1 hypothetical protein EJV47_21285 [Hymenobacter gummosus]
MTPSVAEQRAAQPTAAPRQPWIQSATYDGWLILAPPFLALLVVAVLPDAYRSTAQMPVLGWVVLVLLIDVAHVYSTLFRTYLDPVRRRQQGLLYLLVPLSCYALGVALYLLGGALLFWRVLAYAAVFHFVRQQYGFLRLYSRHEPRATLSHRLDAVLIYAATLYPLLYWHLSPPRHFNWFVDGDFVQRDWPAGRLAISVAYLGLLLVYLLKEAIQWQQTRRLNWPRNLLLLGTAASWYVGIVVFNGDLAFTLLNVVAHGIPYLALVWSAGHQPGPDGRRLRRGAWAGRYGLLIFLGVVGLLAYLEEGIWDGLVWREHTSVFGLFQHLPRVADATLLAWLVPLLALPQATHYVLDGFIWRRSKAAA